MFCLFYFTNCGCHYSQPGAFFLYPYYSTFLYFVYSILRVFEKFFFALPERFPLAPSDDLLYNKLVIHIADIVQW